MPETHGVIRLRIVQAQLRVDLPRLAARHILVGAHPGELARRPRFPFAWVHRRALLVNRRAAVKASQSKQGLKTLVVLSP